MAEHVIKAKTDNGVPVPYNPVAKCQWFTVDGKKDVCLFAESENGIDAAILQLRSQLDEEDRQREEEEASKPKRYRKIMLKVAIANLGKLQALNAWLASFEVAPGYTALEAWGDANELATDYPGFPEFYEAAKSVLGITDEQAAAILEAARITEAQ